MKKFSYLIYCLCFFGLLSGAACNRTKETKGENIEKKEWIQLFNGKNLNGWVPKISGYPAGENYGNTFRVEDGLLRASYDSYEGGFQSRFGHLISEAAFSYYKLRCEYRFYGEQVEGAPGWAYLNNGIMFHSQSAESMIIDQFFPLSVEAQLLANGPEDTGRTTGNVCTPGTEVWIDNELYPHHCANSSSAFYPADEWVTFEMEVYADSLVRHIVNGETVLEYTNLTADKSGIGTISGTDITNEIPIAAGPLKSGHIAIQAEGHSTEFRKIEILDLSDKYKN